jgi:hypothetical protein
VPYLSTVVLQEVTLAEAPAAARMVREINRLAPVALEPTEASEQLAEAYLSAGVIPAKKRDETSASGTFRILLEGGVHPSIEAACPGTMPGDSCARLRD